MTTTETAPLTYSNPRMELMVSDWPSGSKRTTATFLVETHPTRGQRAIRTTIDPKTSKPCAPKALTYARQVRIVDGSDGRTYIAELDMRSENVSIMRSDMKFSHEYVTEHNPRYVAVRALFGRSA